LGGSHRAGREQGKRAQPDSSDLIMSQLSAWYPGAALGIDKSQDIFRYIPRFLVI
jgi:hypothetical protein